MHCWVCDQPAHAVCRFCGRAVCKDHAAKMPTFLCMYLGNNNTPKGLVVADAIWCGVCQPQPEPIGMPEMF